MVELFIVPEEWFTITFMVIIFSKWYHIFKICNKIGEGQATKFQNLGTEGQKKVAEKLVLQTFENHFF